MRRESRETRKKSMVEFVLKEREKAKTLRSSFCLSSRQNEKLTKDRLKTKKQNEI